MFEGIGAVDCCINKLAQLNSNIWLSILILFLNLVSVVVGGIGLWVVVEGFSVVSCVVVDVEVASVVVDVAAVVLVVVVSVSVVVVSVLGVVDSSSEVVGGSSVLVNVRTVGPGKKVLSGSTIDIDSPLRRRCGLLP